MRFSRFAPFGLASFSGGVPLARRIYDAIWANLTDGGRAANYARGGYTDAKVYAQAMALARWLHTGRRLDLQISPITVLELLAEREFEFGVVVPAGASIAERRTALRLAMLPPGDGSYGDIRQALVDLLGPAFVQLRRVAPADQVSKPDLPGNGPGLFILPNGRRRTFKLQFNVTSTAQMGAAEPVPYVHLDGRPVSTADGLQVGERFVLEPEHDLRERVQVAAATGVGGTAAFRAFFGSPHHAGALLTTMPWPYLYSNRRHWIVQLTPAAALDPESRRVVHLVMGRMVRGVSTWDIAGSAGGFTIGVSPLGVTPL